MMDSEQVKVINLLLLIQFPFQFSLPTSAAVLYVIVQQLLSHPATNIFLSTLYPSSHAPDSTGVFPLPWKGEGPTVKQSDMSVGEIPFVMKPGCLWYGPTLPSYDSVDLCISVWISMWELWYPKQREKHLHFLEDNSSSHFDYNLFYYHNFFFLLLLQAVWEKRIKVTGKGMK